ncbi:MAG: Rrf2 family transcriptional regulator [Synergistaceae bacterium]|nr:Rrf2 family transcriptional regulator [Synergistaceae bacterium]
MFLTRECDYAIRVVRDLANQEMKPVKTICEREQIPHPFAYKILKKLEHAGIVNSFRGAVGGYQLAKEPKNITLFDIVSAVDDKLLLNECLQDGYVCARYVNGKFCSVHRELTRIQKVLEKSLSEKTLEDIM